MYYNIERTIEFLPYISWGILVIIFIFLEIRNKKEILTLKPEAEASRGGFIPPSGNGYEYYVSSSMIVFIIQKAKNRFRVYFIQGDISSNLPVKHDKYGKYVTISASDTGTVEKIIDNTFLPS